MANHSADDQANPANKPRNHLVRVRSLIGIATLLCQTNYMASDGVAMLTGRLPNYDLEPFRWVVPQAQLVELILAAKSHPLRVG
jgi:hypothetical protein